MYLELLFNKAKISFIQLPNTLKNFSVEYPIAKIFNSCSPKTQHINKWQFPNIKLEQDHSEMELGCPLLVL